MGFIDRIFKIPNEQAFNETALEIFQSQVRGNETYSQYVSALGTNTTGISHFMEIPFLPILFFKSRMICNGSLAPQKTFLSSGTTGMERSRHPVTDLKVYRESLLLGFEHFFGSITEYDIFALMPSPAENPDSSLIFMVDEWIRHASSKNSGFYLSDFKRLSGILGKMEKDAPKKLVIGLSYALLDFAEFQTTSLPEMIIMETGGMKGKRKEMVREELHAFLSGKLGITVIHSEYGMTELLSQAYSTGNGRFRTPPWMKVVTRDTNDPFQLLPDEVTGCLNIIDLANFNSCSFIATEDLGKTHADGTFEVLGRFDPGNARGCNLMID